MDVRKDARRTWDRKDDRHTRPRLHAGARHAGGSDGVYPQCGARGDGEDGAAEGAAAADGVSAEEGRAEGDLYTEL